ncbi:MAG: AAA family ATPase [Bacteroidales bacterium]|nr:AAA family ATPase [Bacteroidales bacterium]
MKALPSGMSSFREVILSDRYYVDKTMFIPELEKASNFLFLVRPRRFGKSLFLDMLSFYYDVLKKDQFETLFGNLFIGSNPTELRNSFQILKLDFSQVSNNGEGIENNLEKYVSDRLDRFALRYQDFYPEGFLKTMTEMDSSSRKINFLRDSANDCGHNLYLIVDEYDNFTNDILNSVGRERYEQITHDQGCYRNLFKTFKPTFNRILMMGISPVTMDDLTSGFNIATNISLRRIFNSILGFSEDDVAEMVRYYTGMGQITQNAEEILPIMREWYNNYRFSPSAEGHCNSVYNPDMVLYYLGYLISDGEKPSNPEDPNTKMDYSKISQLVQLDNHGSSNGEKLMRLVADESVKCTLIEHFPAEKIADSDNFFSLLFYYGLLTISGHGPVLAPDEQPRIIFSIPNRNTRQQYYTYIRRYFDTFNSEEVDRIKEMFHKMAFSGEWNAVLRYILSRFSNSSGLHDLIGGERSLQAYIKGFLGVNSYYLTQTELELSHGFCDILLMPKKGLEEFVKHSYIIETKMIKTSSGETERKRAYTEAIEELSKYATDPKLQYYTNGSKLHFIILIMKGFSIDSLEEISLS